MAPFNLFIRQFFSSFLSALRETVRLVSWWWWVVAPLLHYWCPCLSVASLWGVLVVTSSSAAPALVSEPSISHLRVWTQCSGNRAASYTPHPAQWARYQLQWPPEISLFITLILSLKYSEDGFKSIVYTSSVLDSWTFWLIIWLFSMQVSLQQPVV